ncbi:hypothetical protein UFOVP1114_9 [uncultured Caudovirales phage]|uniref:Uncharacterized protein n=2 Tax=uncultured Caudovirales phage TaxID=2100421 RepID=A0A6J5QPJ3_9CAUD|nr:hypothetical protein UFOVP1114_9 [uncultured Caudovirales phage]
MSTLYGNNISQTYQGLIKLANSTTGVTATTQSLQDGLGNNIPIQVSTNVVNISGSLLVNGLPIEFTNTGSFATTGSNTFIGNQTITGSVLISGSAPFDLVVTGSARLVSQDALSQLTMSPSSFNVNSTKTISGGAEGFIFGSTGSNAQFYLGVYDEPNFTTDVELNIKVDSNGISFNDWDNVTAGAYIPFMNIAPNLGDNPTPQMLRGLDITGSLGVTNIQGTGSLFLQPNQSDARFVEIYNTSPTDTHITASGGQIFLGDDVTYVKVDNYGSVKHIDIVADNGVNISGSVQVTGSLDITDNITANSASFNYLHTIYETASIIYSSGSNQLGDELTDTQTLSGSVQVQGELLVNGVPVVTGSVNRDGLITTGSLYGVTEQSITGSLYVSGSGGISIGTGNGNDDTFNGVNLSSNDVASFLIVKSKEYAQFIFGVNDSPAYNYDNQFNIVQSTGSTQFTEYNQNTDYNYRPWLQVQASTSGTSGIKPIQLLRNTEITGSLTEVGNVYMLSPAFNSGSIKLNITGSANFVSQSNLIFGSVAGATSAVNTGSIILSGSNNILLVGVRTNTTPQGTFGYISGNSNIMNIVPTIATGSLGVNTVSNILYGAVILDAPITSSFGSGVTTSTFNGNITTQQNTTTFRHKSGSFSHIGNLTMGNFTSFATSSWFDDNLSVIQYNANILQGSNTAILNVSSSVLLTRNIINSNSTTINNQFTNPNNYLTQGSGSLSLTNNIFGGTTHTILSSGSNLTSRAVVNNLVVGSTHLLNQISSGSNNTIISNTAVLGASLIVSGSNTSQASGGSTFVGRFNATGSLQEGTNEAVFVVGTGTAAGSRRNALHIDSNNNTRITGSVTISGSLTVNGVTVSSDRNGLITTGSAGGGTIQSITGSLSISQQTILTGSVTIGGGNSNLNIQSGSINLNNNGQSQISNQGSGRNVLYVDNTYSNFFFGNVPKGQSGRFSGDTNNFILSPTYSDFQTGSNNLIFAVNNSFFNSGSRNIFIGDGQPFGNSVDDSLYIGMNGGNNQSIITKRGGGSSNPIQLGFPTQVTGSLTVVGNTTISGSLIVTDKINNLKIWTGSYNGESIGIGNYTLNLQTGSSLFNIAIGNSALANNVTGSNNVAIGYNSLGNSVAGFNVALGGSALSANTTGQWNIGIGQSSFQANTTGDYNTAIGWNSAVNNITGSTNTAIGAQALQNNISGSGNVAIGRAAGYYSTSSNEFFVANQLYGGGVDGERSGSLFYGKFDSTTANQTLQINAQTNIVGSLLVNGLPITGSAGGDRNGLINTGSIAETQSITGSLIISGSQTITGSLLLNNNNSTIISNTQTIPSGSGNVIIGSGSILPNNLTNNIVIGAGGNSVFTYNGSVDRITLQKATTLVNGLNVTGSVNISGSAIGPIPALQLTGVQFFNATYADNTCAGSFNGGLLEISRNGAQAGLTINGNNDHYIKMNEGVSSTTTLIRNFKSTSAVTGLRGGTWFGNNDLLNGLFVSSSISTGVGNYMGFGADRNGYTLGNYVFSNTDGSSTKVFISGSLSAIGDVKFASGSNKTMGTVTLDGGNPGTITVSNSLVTTGSMIFLTKQTLTNAHSVGISSKGSGTFTITSTGNGDNDVVAYQIINPI